MHSHTMSLDLPVEWPAAKNEPAALGSSTEQDSALGRGPPRQSKIRPAPMKKKPLVIRFPKAKPAAEINDRSWHRGGDIEIGFYARSLQKAAKTLIATLDLEPNSKAAWDAC